MSSSREWFFRVLLILSCLLLLIVLPAFYIQNWTFLSIHINVDMGDVPRQPSVKAAASMQCSGIAVDYRLDCYPAGGASQQTCLQRGCCWAPAENVAKGVPSCYYPIDFPTYQMGTPKQTPFGYSVMLTRTSKSYMPGDIMQLQMDLYLETSYRLHFKIFDPNSKRYEVPIPTPKVSKRVPSTDYKVEFSKSPMGLVVTRLTDGAVVFNSTIGPLIYADQFIQISTSLTTPYIYGLGEHRGSFRLPSNWTTFPIWTRDHFVVPGGNLYGAHPFYLNLEGSSGSAHGVFLLNSNAMEVALQPAPALTYRTIGGILDFYIFMGPTSEQVIQQYTEVIGRPFMVPYWGLGFHLCRWGYGTANRTLEIVKKMKAALIPQDTQWNDIEYSEGRKDFTVNRTTFGELPNMIDYLHTNWMHYILIIDPAISSGQPIGLYPPYDSGIEEGVFIRNDTGQPLQGKVWPGPTVFPDFFLNKTVSWWFDHIQDFHDWIKFDGIWIDMNEPSNFVNGSLTGCPKNEYNNPPYVPAIFDGFLARMTICPSAIQVLSRHYNLHNLYGHSESVATRAALEKLRKKRSFVISRSTYAGSGKHTGHWLGDNASEWPDMAFSIAGILAFNLFGIPLVGADICGFNGNTTEELCQRWMQLGAFYPFSRNHNTLHAKDQDPTAFSPSMQSSSKKALNTRYGLLPYIYTLFHYAHISGSTVARPLFFEFPGDAKLYDVDRQFMLGPAIVVTPVLEKGATTVNGTFPKGTWFGLYHSNHVRVKSTQTVTLPAALDDINVHVRGGHIIPMQMDSKSTTTTEYRKLPFTLLNARSDDGRGTGHLYWDDGDSLDTYETGKYLSLAFTTADQWLNSTVVHNGYSGSKDLSLKLIILTNISREVSEVTVNGTLVLHGFNTTLQTVYILDLKVPMQYEFFVNWKYLG